MNIIDWKKGRGCMDKLYNLTIDTKLKTYQKIYGMKQFENNVVLNITLVQNSVPLDLSGCTVRLNYQNKNEVLLQMANIISEKEGKVRVTVLTKVLDTTGETPVDISVFDADQRKITSSTFVLVVQESIYNNDKIDEEELDLIQGIFNKEKERQAAEKKREENEVQREANDKIRDEKINKIEEDCEKCKEDVNTQIHKFDTQEKEKQANELERIENENLRKTDEQQRVKQENKREENETIRVTSETKRVESMGNIEKEWEEIKKDLGSSGGTGDMMKAIYDTNNDGKVDMANDSEKLGNIEASQYIRKNNNTTWGELNTHTENSTGKTDVLSLERPSIDDEILLTPFNKNFTTLDDTINRLGYGNLITLYDKDLSYIDKGGVYVIENLVNAPDIPPKNKRIYLVKAYVINSSASNIHYDIYSLGTGKMYTYNSQTKVYTDVYCEVPNHAADFYIDPINGDDDNTGEADSHIKTFKCLESRIPHIINKPITIHIVNNAPEGNNRLTLRNISVNYSGESIYVYEKVGLTIKSLVRNTMSNITLDNIRIPSSKQSINLENLTINSTWVYNCSPISFNRVYSKMFLEDTFGKFNLCSGQYFAENNSTMYISAHDNSSYPFEHKYGIVSSNMSRVIYTGDKPTGTSTDLIQQQGGTIKEE